MVSLVLLLLVLVGVLFVLVLVARYFVCIPVLRAAQQIDTLIQQGVTCGRCGNLVQAEARNHERGDEIFFEVRSAEGTHRLSMGAQSKDNYQQPPEPREDVTRVQPRNRAAS
ncbi:MAG: hypothetical protein M3416_00120 [Acidobacteriota bacterium]|nr:hypothetical protein [Acidobacteriota bacterium]